MKKILVIEDKLEVREALEDLLEISGYEVFTARDGVIGIEKTIKIKPDLILCDVMMPKLDGFEVLSLLSKKPATADIPFIFLTAKTDKKDIRRGMGLGADDYITKPFLRDDLLNAIEIRLKKSSRLKKTFDRTALGLNRFIEEAKGYEALQKLSNDRKINYFRKKEVIFYKDNTPRYLFFIKKGKVKLVKTNEFGKEFIISILTTGDFMGYTPLITGENYSFEAVAMDDKTEINLIPKTDFLKLLFDSREVSSQLIKMLANNVAHKEEQLINLAYSTVRKRVANSLLSLYDKHKKLNQYSIKILRDDLAQTVGTSRESVARMLTELKSDGYIATLGGAITILDEQGLQKVNW